MPKNRTSACGRMLERVLPPNVPAGVMCRLMAYSLALGALVAAVDFAVRYGSTYRLLFNWNGRVSETALMNAFYGYAEPVLLIFGLVVRRMCFWEGWGSLLPSFQAHIRLK